MLRVRGLLLGLALTALAGTPTTAQSIYPRNRAEILLGSKFAFKVELDGKRVPLQAAIYQTAFASWLSPRNASLAFALAFVTLWFGILYLLYRRRIVFRV